MRYAKIYRGIAWEGRISPNAKAVYMALAQYANKFRQCWPSREKLMRDAGFSNRLLTRALNELRDWGVVTWEKGFSGKPNLYTLTDEIAAAKIERGEVLRVSTQEVLRVSTNENHRKGSANEDPAKYGT